MAWHRALAGLLAGSAVILAVTGEILALAHVAGALGLFLLVLGASVGVGAWVALGAPRSRADIRA